tara:strand:+ start:932 stop:1105 length:174 start_codon:yes stop_codon:yes gene_type:complete
MNNIKFNKTQLEIISYFLELNVEEIQNKKIKQETINALIKLQSKKIWGNLPSNIFEE